MTLYTTVLVHTDDQGVSTVTLNRPEVKNALNALMIRELTQVMMELSASSATRLVVINSSGTVFCAGADLNHMQQIATFGYDENLSDALQLGDLFAAINQCHKPVITVVQGGAYGGGVGLIAASDICIASSDSKFCLSEVRLGIVPGVISPYLVNAIGQRQAQRFALTAEIIPSDLALDIGLIHYSTNNTIETLNTVVAQLLKGSTSAQSATKSLFRAVGGYSITPELKSSAAQAIATARSTADGQEGLKAFLEKRHPYWIKKHD